MVKLSGSIRSWSSIFRCMSTTNRMIGSTSFPWPSLHTTTCHIQRPWSPPFFANKGFDPKLEVSLEPIVSDTAHQVTTDLKELHLYLPNQVSHALKQYEVHSMLRHLLIPLFKVRDTVWLDSQNIRTTRPSKKLDHHFLGPFLIMEKVLSHAFQLGLSLALT